MCAPAPRFVCTFIVQMHMCMRIVFVLHAETLWVHLAACVLFREC